ncbi:MAG: hypothetical protein L3J07_02555 [Candidatus Magasanikbacteria bacterium]|nr:hypothetical protein [Candidatus Magasanikbacteria bacterium]
MEDLGSGVIRVVDANFVSSNTVGVHDWDIDSWMDTYSTLYLHVYRLGSTTENEYVFNEYRQLESDWSTKACRGITGSSSTNWVYSCTTETYTYYTGQTVYVLSGIHNIREEHRFKTIFYRNDEVYATQTSGWNSVSPYVWEHGYTWHSLHLSQAGTYQADVYVDTIDDDDDDWEYLDYVPINVPY